MPVPPELTCASFLAISSAAQAELRNYIFPKTDDPEVRARQLMIARWALESCLETPEEVLNECLQIGIEIGQIQGARAALRAVLEARGLALGADEVARIDTCSDHGTLQRWVKQATVAASAAEALR